MLFTLSPAEQIIQLLYAMPDENKKKQTIQVMNQCEHSIEFKINAETMLKPEVYQLDAGKSYQIFCQTDPIVAVASSRLVCKVSRGSTLNVKPSHFK